MQRFFIFIFVALAGLFQTMPVYANSSYISPNYFINEDDFDLVKYSCPENSYLITYDETGTVVAGGSISCPAEGEDEFLTIPMSGFGVFTNDFTQPQLLTMIVYSKDAPSICDNFTLQECINQGYENLLYFQWKNATTSLFILPSGQSMLTNATDYAGNLGSAFGNLIYIAIGLAAAAILVAYVIAQVKRKMRKVGK